MGAAQEALEEDPLAQAGVAHLEGVEATRVHRHRQDECRAEDDVPAVGLDARELPALGCGTSGELVDQLVEHPA